MEHAPEADRAAPQRSELARTIMRRQSRIGLRVALAFLIVLLGLPLLNLYEPEIMATSVGGFSLAWLFLGMGLYPVMWLLSWLFVRGSDRIEEEIVREFAGRESLAVGPGIAPEPLSADVSPPSTTHEPRPTKRKLFVEEEDAE